MLGAWMFACISEKLGNLRALMITIIDWTLICIGVFNITDAIQFLAAAFFIGLVMGGSQSLARSTYSKMLLFDTTGHTSFFSFYDAMEKLATVAGIFSFGAIEEITGNMRFAVLAIALFFVFSLFFMWLLNRETRINASQPLL